MPCYHPITGWRAREANPATGKRSIVFNPKAGCSDEPVTLPCGQCVGCRLEKSRQWAIRCVHEASLYEQNCFLTLTYNDAHLPKDGSLDLVALQKFLKRLRFWVSEQSLLNPESRLALGGPEIRFFACGEYGEKMARPHYHLCVFNLDFADKTLWSTRENVKLYRSESLERLWSDPATGLSLGYSTIGDVTFESAAYVARYVTKKITGPRALSYYTDFNRCSYPVLVDGVIYQPGEVIAELRPEFCTMSRRPGLGRPFVEKHGFNEIYNTDSVVLRGKELKPPKYYDYLFDIDNPDGMEIVKESRRRQACKNASDRTWERLAVREEIHLGKSKLLVRGLEKNETQDVHGP